MISTGTAGVEIILDTKRNNMKKIASLQVCILLLCILLLFVLPLGAQEDGHHHGTSEHGAQEDASQEKSGALHLSPELRTLLTGEMLAVQSGMMTLVPAIASGDWEMIAKTGMRIHDSYILKQELSAEQLNELHHVLPRDFLEMDQDFHRSAAMLAHAAEQKNADVVGFYFYKLTAACVECHGKYAADVFPRLAPESATSHHGHDEATSPEEKGGHHH